MSGRMLLKVATMVLFAAWDLRFGATAAGAVTVTLTEMLA